MKKDFQINVNTKNNFRHMRNLLKNEQDTVCLIACAANEKLYIKDWVEYYLNDVKVDRIVIIDNNFSDNEKLRTLLQPYKKVTVITKYRKKRINQSEVYSEMYKRFARIYDWLMFLDVDEYLVMNNKKGLKDWLSNVDKKIDEIFVNWKIFDDNDLVKYDKRPVMKRFIRPFIEDKTPESNPEYFKESRGNYYYIRDNFQVKSIVRGGIYDRYIRNYTHKFEFKNGYYVDNELKKVALKEPNPYSLKRVNYTNCQINHYIQKTIEEYIDRAMARTMRSCKIYKDIDQIRHNFQRFNKWTDEKEKILQDKFKKKK